MVLCENVMVSPSPYDHFHISCFKYTIIFNRLNDVNTNWLWKGFSLEQKS